MIDMYLLGIITITHERNKIYKVFFNSSVQKLNLGKFLDIFILTMSFGVLESFRIHVQLRNNLKCFYFFILNSII